MSKENKEEIIIETDIDQDKIEKIKEALKEGKKLQKDIAKEFDVSPSYVSKIKKDMDKPKKLPKPKGRPKPKDEIKSKIDQIAPPSISSLQRFVTVPHEEDQIKQLGEQYVGEIPAVSYKGMYAIWSLTNFPMRIMGCEPISDEELTSLAYLTVEVFRKHNVIIPVELALMTTVAGVYGLRLAKVFAERQKEKAEEEETEDKEKPMYGGW